ncbi:lipid-A-disaccharide synthase [bacterium]|nr:lipid-A-disaccharide synthase [bacterium]
MAKSLKIMISACELSADNYAAELVKALKSLAPHATIFGVGGPACKKAGMDVKWDMTALSTVGLIEPILFLPKLYQSLTKMKAMLKENQPDLFIPLDNQGLHGACCNYAKKLGIKTVYYIAPQHWHWGKKEDGVKLASMVNHILAIFKQEERFYQSCGAAVTYVGHPITDRIKPYRNLPKKEPVLSIFPGSREHEIKRLLPDLVIAAETLAKEYSLVTTISIASPAYRELIKSLVDNYAKCNVQFHEGASLELISKSALSLVSSGTVSLEHALLGVPHVVTYRFHPITYWLATTFFKKTLEKIPYMSMPNMLLNKELFPELLQDKFSVDSCIQKANYIYKNQETLNNDCNHLWDILYRGSVAEQAATQILSLL